MSSPTAPDSTFDAATAAAIAAPVIIISAVAAAAIWWYLLRRQRAQAANARLPTSSRRNQVRPQRSFDSIVPPPYTSGSTTQDVIALGLPSSDTNPATNFHIPSAPPNPPSYSGKADDLQRQIEALQEENERLRQNFNVV